MKIRSTSIALAALVAGSFLASPSDLLARGMDPAWVMSTGLLAGETSQSNEEENHYNLSWKLKQADHPEQDSMVANFTEKVEAVEKAGKWTIKVTIKKESDQLIDKFYFYKDGEKKEASKEGDSWSFTLDQKPEGTIKIGFKVSVMSEEKDALLVIEKYEKIDNPSKPGQPQTPPGSESGGEGGETKPNVSPQNPDQTPGKGETDPSTEPGKTNPDTRKPDKKNPDPADPGKTEPGQEPEKPGTGQGETGKEDPVKKALDSLKKYLEAARRWDLSNYTEESQRDLKNLLDRISKKMEENLSEEEIRQLEGEIRGWRGQIKQSDQTIRYNVPVSLVKSDGSRSMAASALSGWARIDQCRDRYTYYLQFQAMDMNGSKGHMTRLFYYENGRKYEARYHGGDLWSFSLNRKTPSQKIAVWVDVMDQIAGGPGKGEQDAYLSFDWGQAREVGRFDGEMRQAEQAAPPVEAKDQEQNPEQKLAEKKTLMASQSQKEVDAVLRDFRDVPANHWAMKAIAHAYARGYFKGQGGGQFAPDRSISRGEFVTILGRKAGFVGAKTSSKFKDVPSNAYYAAYVAWAESKGIIQGTSSKTFDPDRTISREEMALILDKFLAKEGKTYPAGNGASFYDQASIASWAKGSVDKMVKQGILSGTGNGTFSPQAKFSRGQAAQILYVMDLKDKK